MHLHLGNSIKYIGAITLDEAFYTNVSLQTLILSDNGIGDIGATTLAEVLKTSIALQTIYLRSNNIGNVGALTLVETLQTTNTFLLNIIFDDNWIEDGIAKRR